MEGEAGLSFERRSVVYARLGRAMLSHAKRDAAARLYVRSMGIGGGAEADELGKLLSMFTQRDTGEHESR